MPNRIGLFGGTFDPPHVGHLVTAVNVRYALGLDSVVLMVANSPWQKDGTRPISPAEDRLAMVEAAFRDTTLAEVLAEPTNSHPLCELPTGKRSR